MVKAFDRVPHRLLAREAAALGFPLWLVQLSIATYRFKRIIRIGAVVSWELVALRGITAGSGFATTEMRAILMRIVDRAWKLPLATRLFDDDLSAEATAPTKKVVEVLGGFVEEVARRFKEENLELSGKTPLCTASTGSLGKQ